MKCLGVRSYETVVVAVRSDTSWIGQYLGMSGNAEWLNDLETGHLITQKVMTVDSTKLSN